MLVDLEPIAKDLAYNRQLLDEIVNRLSDQDFERSPRPSDYNGRQILAHLAGAERGMTALMRRMAAGEAPRLKPEYSNDYYNERQQAKRAHLSVEQLRAELISTRSDLLAFMESLKADDLDKVGQHPVAGDTTVLGVLRVLQGHELDHIRDLENLA